MTRGTPRTARAWAAAAIAGTLCAAGLASLSACVDLFHSTADIEDACQLDASACNSSDGTDFCAWSRDEARANAARACAWLGACQSPLGGNAFGTCMFDALLAYDCAANPDHPARGAEHALWDCLWRVTTCDDVARCVFPGGTPACGSTDADFVACGNAGGVEANGDVRVECSHGGAPVAENCALHGQTCATLAGVATCAGGATCGPTSCEGTKIHECSGGVDVGVDCASSGAGACGGFPTTASPSWVACLASGSGTCTPSVDARCAGGVASSCASGVPESIDCAALLMTAPDAGCVTGARSPAFDWTSPCRVPQGGCTADSCDGTRLTGCARGSTYATDCAAQGLGPCRSVTTDADAATSFACSRPQ